MFKTLIGPRNKAKLLDVNTSPELCVFSITAENLGHNCSRLLENWQQSVLTTRNAFLCVKLIRTLMIPLQVKYIRNISTKGCLQGIRFGSNSYIIL